MVEIPFNNRVLKKLVIKHVLYGPHTKYSICTDNKRDMYKKQFQKKFCKKTSFKENGYPQYKRSDERSYNSYSK